MVRLLLYFLTILLVASGLAWLADRPGSLVINWQGYDIDTSVFVAAVLLTAAIAAGVFLWSVIRTIWNSPATLGNRIVRRRQKRGLEALSSGMIAVGAGDKVLASRYAAQARKTLPHEPLTQLLRAQAAELSGDRATTRRIYEAMLASPETEQLGLRGLYLEANREGETIAAQQFAERALKANPRLDWSAESLFEIQCKQKDWEAALETLTTGKRSGTIAKNGLDRKRAVLLTALAVDEEEADPDKALSRALEANSLAPDLVPSACVAGRILAARGNTAKAAKVLQRTWARTPHPDIAEVYAYARIGDSTRDRLDRVRQLAALNPQSIESPIAVARTAIDARLFPEAKKALEPLLPDRLTHRVAMLLAQAEAGDSGDKGKIREWLARAANAARDPVWIADGVISNHWEPISPVDGRLDAFQWRVPTEMVDQAGIELDASRLEALLALEGPLKDSAGDDDDRPDRGSTAHDDADIIDAEAVTVAPNRANTGKTPAAEDLKPAPSEKSASAAAPVAEPAEAGSNAGSDPEPALPSPPTAATANTDAKASSQPAPSPSAKPAPADAAARSTPPEARIFVTPPAPDDPGPDTGAEDNVTALPLRPYRAAH